MKVCDLCMNLKGLIQKEKTEIVVDHQVFHLCEEHERELVEFLTREDKRRKGLAKPAT